MRKNQPITSIMHPDPVTVHLGTPFSKVRGLFEEHGLHHLPVVSGRELIGMVSWSDLMRVSFGSAFGTDDRAVDATLDHTLSLEDIMTPNPTSIDANSSIRQAAEILGANTFHALPVVRGKELVGVVSSQDLLKFLVTLF